MINNDKTYRLMKSLNLYSTAANTSGRSWEITMLDEKMFPSVVCAQNYTDDTINTIIKIYDIKNIPELITEFILPRSIYFHKTPSSISSGLNYDDGILTFVEKVHPNLTDPSDNNSNLYRMT